MYKVLHDFRDLQDKRKQYTKGDAFPAPANKKISDKRIKELSGKNNKTNKPVIEEIKEVEEQE